MATLYSSEYTSALVTVPAGKLAPEDLNGRIRRAYAEFTLGAELADGDIVKMIRLPANAVLIEARFVAPAATSGNLDIGVVDSDESGENDDADYLLNDLDISSAVDDSSFAMSSAAGFNAKVSKELDIQILADGAATVGANGDVWKLEVRYVID